MPRGKKLKGVSLAKGKKEAVGKMTSLLHFALGVLLGRMQNTPPPPPFRLRLSPSASALRPSASALPPQPSALPPQPFRLSPPPVRLSPPPQTYALLLIPSPQS